MPKGKHYVFSARTTEEGLRILNRLKADLRLAWGELVLDAVCTRYNLDRAAKTKRPETRRLEPAFSLLAGVDLN